MSQASSVSGNLPRVGILMGSDSDWPRVQAAANALQEFGVPYEVHVMSAHRTPHRVAEYATTAAERGIQVIIAAAGGAAQLAGVVAGHTTLPVIGLPVPTPELGGLDSLLSMVQMPGDIPVACMAVGMGGIATRGCSRSRSWPRPTLSCGTTRRIPPQTRRQGRREGHLIPSKPHQAVRQDEDG